MGVFRKRKRGTWRTIRADYQQQPRHTWSHDEEAHWWQNCSEQEYWGEWERWSRETEPHPTIRAIRRTALDMAREAARETDGHAIQDAGGAVREDGGTVGAEFACLLGIEGNTIHELVLLPGTVAGDEHAIFDFLMQPQDKAIRGTLHSHPDEHPYPSDADLELFDAHGEIHLILCRPYGPDDWRAYDRRGMPVSLEVV